MLKLALILLTMLSILSFTPYDTILTFNYPKKVAFPMPISNFQSHLIAFYLDQSKILSFGNRVSEFHRFDLHLFVICQLVSLGTSTKFCFLVKSLSTKYTVHTKNHIYVMCKAIWLKLTTF